MCWGNGALHQQKVPLMCGDFFGNNKLIKKQQQQQKQQQERTKMNTAQASTFILFCTSLLTTEPACQFIREPDLWHVPTLVCLKHCGVPASVEVGADVIALEIRKAADGVIVIPWSPGSQMEWLVTRPELYQTMTPTVTSELHHLSVWAEPGSPPHRHPKPPHLHL